MAGIDYTVNTEDTTTPTDNNVARKGAAEIRALKARIIGLSGILFTAAGTADALTGTLPALTNGLKVLTVPVGANTVVAPTLNGVQIVKQNSTTGALEQLAAGDYNASNSFSFRYQAIGFGGNPSWVLNGALTAQGESVGTVKVWPGLELPDANWDWCDGGALSRATYDALFSKLMKTAEATLPLASPGIVTWVGHGLRNNHPVKFTTTGTLPTGVVAGTTYYIANKTADTFNITATPGGANIDFTVLQNGTHTAICAPHGDGDGTTTFNKPDFKGRIPVGRDDMGGAAANRITFAESGIYGVSPANTGGTQAHALTTAELATHAHSAGTSALGTGIVLVDNTPAGAFNVVAVGTTTGNAGSGDTHQNTQPSIIEDWIIRIQ